jgi:SAM-dependent methyltransferase
VTGFSKEWERRFRAGGNISRWPWSDVVSYVHRYARPLSDFKRVLELGCAAGPNIPFFLSLGVNYHAVEGSETIVAQVRTDFPELSEQIVVGDFTRAIPFPGPFDLVIDRSSLTHNTTDAIRWALGICFDRLRSGGKYIGCDWFSTLYPDTQRGVMLDQHTRTGIPDGQFLDLGAVHFSDRPHLETLLVSAGFVLEILEHKRVDTLIPTGEAPKGWWSFVAVKP